VISPRRFQAGAHGDPRWTPTDPFVRDSSPVRCCKVGNMRTHSEIAETGFEVDPEHGSMPRPPQPLARTTRTRPRRDRCRQRLNSTATPATPGAHAGEVAYAQPDRGEYQTGQVSFREALAAPTRPTSSLGWGLNRSDSTRGNFLHRTLHRDFRLDRTSRIKRMAFGLMIVSIWLIKITSDRIRRSGAFHSTLHPSDHPLAYSCFALSHVWIGSPLMNHSVLRLHPSADTCSTGKTVNVQP